MTKITEAICRALALASMSLGTSACLDGEVEEDVEALGEVDENIINGTIPASVGALASYGVVRTGTPLLGYCTGTLLTNRHVLTAHHCTGRYGIFRDWKGTLYAAGALPVSFETSSGVLTAYNESFIESPQPWSTGANDFSIIVLDRPIEIGGAPDQHYRRIYASSDATLDDKVVTCIGYGGTIEATPTTPSGGNRLTSASLSISSVADGLLKIDRQNEVVQFGGDSGSTCFLGGRITGVASQCSTPKYYDHNGNGLRDGWSEVYDVSTCESSAPSNFRQFVADHIMGSVTLRYETVPTLPPGTTLGAVVTTTSGQTAINALSTSSVSGPRSGRITSVVATDTVNMVCPEVQTQVPMQGTVTLGGTCLDNALMSSLLGS